MSWCNRRHDGWRLGYPPTCYAETDEELFIKQRNAKWTMIDFNSLIVPRNNDGSCDSVSVSYGFASIQLLAKFTMNRSASAAVLNRSGSPSIVCEYRWP